ncbi:MAG TPA: AMP-binding protein, partial [Opitutus sp.]|nr:AMP-binding protein [Opitutus sp.]
MVPPSASPLVARFQTWSDRAPTAPAVTDGHAALTYRELDIASDTLARRIRPHLQVSARVAVALPRSLASVVSCLAVWKAGGSYVPLDDALPTRRQQELLDDSGVALILGTPSQPVATRLPFASVDVTELLANAAAAPAPAARLSSSEAYVLFTSGSTGRPKGVAIPDEAIARLVIEPDYVRIAPDDVVLHFAPLSFDAATFEVWAPLLNGARLAILAEPRPSPSVFRRFLREQGCTVAWLTSGLFNALVDADPLILQPLRHVLAGGEALSPSHVARARAALPSLTFTNGYGPTENTTFTCCYALPRGVDVADWPSIPIGAPIKGTTIVVVDEHDQPVPAGTPGELLAAGAGLALGYTNDAA